MSGPTDPAPTGAGPALYRHADEAPDRVALALGTQSVSYRELADRAVRLANLLSARGMVPGDVVALLSEVSVRYHEVVWACRIAGFSYTTVSTQLGADEVHYILSDSGAKALVLSGGVRCATDLAADLPPTVEHRFAQRGAFAGFEDYDEALLSASPERPVRGPEGQLLQYSSGTTGRPKGIVRDVDPGTPSVDIGTVLMMLLGVPEGAVYLSPAPLYHTAPIMWSMAVLSNGGTVVLMDKFDAEDALRLIQEHRVTHGQFVPTMFVRMLKLAAEVRARYDLSSLRAVVHAAAPCPIEVKRKMLGWWGPIIAEYWSSSEGAGFTWISAEEWLEHPGSVGKPLMGPMHVCDEDGNELPPGSEGVLWAETPGRYHYLNDPDKDRSTTHPQGWRTVGDVGRIDDDGYLYLTDRLAFMIISGGVNIYPQECEDVLIEHPAVFDVAVIGVPNDEMGEEVRAVVQPVRWADAGPELEAELIAWARGRLAHYKCPRQVDFLEDLPRSDTGKLFKKSLRETYWRDAVAVNR